MARKYQKKPPMTPEQISINNELLQSIKEQTLAIRSSQEIILASSVARTKMVLQARSNRVSYRLIALAMGTSEQSVYKIMRPYLKAQNK